MQTLPIEPLWDEGISSYLLGEYAKLQTPLTIQNIESCAVDQAVRVGDLLETLFIMAIYGEWTYTAADGVAETLNESALDDFYAKGRLNKDGLAAFSGVWAPA
ncbi:MAG: hypothetical protein ACI9UN_001505 [Granulosicoccus sp.]|jgi:hypothetical protein